MFVFHFNDRAHSAQLNTERGVDAFHIYNNYTNV